jgi:TRAP-type mannitol/chloroaromatic compound transport system permease small subunit
VAGGDDDRRPAGRRPGAPDDVVHQRVDSTLSEVETPPGPELEIIDAPLWLRPLLVYQRAIDWVTERVGALPKYLAVAVIVIGFVNAVLRYIGRFAGAQLTSNRNIELQWYLYAALFLLAFAYILKHGINVRVDFWFADCSPKVKAWIDFVGNLIGLLPFCLLGSWVVSPQILRSFGRSPDGSWRTLTVWEICEQSPDPVGLPRAPVKALLFVGLGLLLLQGLAEMVKLVAVLTGHGRFSERTVRGVPTRVE